MAVVNMREGGDFVRVDRRTRWGNPFILGRDGDRETVVELYRRWLWQQLKEGAVSISELASLHGKVLGCWCAPQACHAEVLERAAAWAYGVLNEPLEP